MQLGFVLDVAFKAYGASNQITRNPIDYAHMCNTKGVGCLDKGLFSQAEKYLTKCKDIGEKLLKPDHEELANIYNNLGNVAYSKLDYVKAREFHIRAEAICTTFDNDEMRDDARFRLNRAVELFKTSGNWYMLAQEKGDLGMAKKCYNDAKEHMINIGKARTQYTTAAVLYKLGCVACDEGDFDGAIQNLRESLLLAEYNQAATGDRARVSHKLGEALQAKDSTDQEALQRLEEAARLRRGIEGDEYREEDQSESAYDKLVSGNIR
ncbi:hypothetical protein QQX98_012096 [Neonectria punicea]|uniref:MalT-like TPR region domain-containing protein n=1 Tax=Neonectria punicea TaxID=979145 RepID=A0ABR1GJZ8_9HYPO